MHVCPGAVSLSMPHVLRTSAGTEVIRMDTASLRLNTLNGLFEREGGVVASGHVRMAGKAMVNPCHSQPRHSNLTWEIQPCD